MRRATSTYACPIVRDVAHEGSHIPVDVWGHKLVQLELDARHLSLTTKNRPPVVLRWKKENKLRVAVGGDDSMICGPLVPSVPPREINSICIDLTEMTGK